MTKFLLTAASIVAMASSANAQNVVASPFSGAYVGVQGSIAQLDDYADDLDYWYTGIEQNRTSDRGALIGLRAGYDVQSGVLLGGVMVEGSIGRVNSFDELSSTPNDDPILKIGTRVKKLGSIRLKGGVTSGNLAAFVTAGLALSDAKQKFRETDGSDELYDGKGDRTGYVLGLGAAYAINANSTLGLDYSHYEFGSKTHDLLESDGDFTDYRWAQDYKVRALTLSFNYGF